MRKKYLIFCGIIFCCIGQAAQPTAQEPYKIMGLTGAELANARLYLQPLFLAEKIQLSGEQKQQELHQAPRLVRKSLEPFGYFKPQIHINMLSDGTLSINVDPGPQLHITQIKILITGEGVDNPALKKLQTDFPLHIGQPLLTQTYNQAKQELFNTAQKQGYLNAQLTQHVIYINLKHYTAAIILELNTGPRYYFGLVNFSKTPLNPEFLQRFIPFKKGQPYSADEVFVLQDALNSSKYFQQVSVSPQIQKAQNYYVPVDVTLTPRKLYTYTLGAGYGTDTGVRGLLGWTWRPVNAEGHYFSSQLNLSQVQNVFQAVYSIPGNNPVTDRYDLSASALQNNLPQGTSLTEQFGISKITQKDFWQRTYSVNYQFEKFQFTGENTQYANLLIPGISWVYLKSDNPLFTSRGNRFSVRLQGAGNQLFSDQNFLQTEVQDKYIYTFYKSRILLRGDMGYTTVSDLADFPLSLRFYAGGTQSVRGYKYQSIGPGRYLQVGSAEYQHQIIGKWSGAVFYDVGNASNHFWGQSLNKAVGLGIVWASPVGPMELTLAQALSRPGHPFQIQFSMGPDLA